jgi:hypothetical protein
MTVNRRWNLVTRPRVFLPENGTETRLDPTVADPSVGGPPPMGTGALFPGVKRQRREADHSPPTSAEAKKT